MAGGLSNSKPSNPKPPPPSSSSAATATHRKSRWEPPSSAADAVSSDPKPNPKANPNPNPNPKPAASPKPKPSPASGGAHAHHHHHHPPPPQPHPQPPPPSYGFHMLERRTIALADGSVRTYWALPPDYQEFPPVPRRFLGPPLGPMSPPGPSRRQDYWNSLGLDGGGGGGGPAGKRKLPEEEERDRRRREGKEEDRGPLGRFGNPGGEDSRAFKSMRTGNGGFGGGTGAGDRRELAVATKHSEVDQAELKKAFHQYAKTVNENVSQKRIYLENGKHGRLHCAACGRSTKDFPDTHSLIMHCYNSDNVDLKVDHLGLHKAICALMGWNYSIPPDNSKAYQYLSADVAAANQDDLIMWPPMVIIHNTLTGKNRDGRMEGLGNKLMDTKIRDLGFPGGKSKSLYGREGHLGITLIKFSGDQAGLKEAKRLSDYFERDNHGRMAWSHLQHLTLGSKDDENNPYLMKFDERTREKKRILYGYLLTASDIDKVDFDTRKKVTIESQREYRSS